MPRRAGAAPAPRPGGAGGGHCGARGWARGAGRRRGSAGTARGRRAPGGEDATFAAGRGCALPPSGGAEDAGRCSALQSRAAAPASPLVTTAALSPRGRLRDPSLASPRLHSLSPQLCPPSASSRPFPNLSVTCWCPWVSEGRRSDPRVRGLPALAAREQQAPGICGRRTEPRHGVVGRLLGLPGCLCRTSSFSQATGPRRVLNTSVQCGDEEGALEGVKCLSRLGMEEETRLYGDSPGSPTRTHRFAHTNFCSVTLLYIRRQNKTSFATLNKRLPCGAGGLTCWRVAKSPW